jgi:hypothetical protein
MFSLSPRSRPLTVTQASESDDCAADSEIGELGLAQKKISSRFSLFTGTLAAPANHTPDRPWSTHTYTFYCLYAPGPSRSVKGAPSHVGPVPIVITCNPEHTSPTGPAADPGTDKRHAGPVPSRIYGPFPDSNWDRSLTRVFAVLLRNRRGHSPVTLSASSRCRALL